VNEFFLVCFEKYSVEPTLVDESLHKRNLEGDCMAISMSSDLAQHRSLGTA
jgi:hypothetical protein